MSEKETFWSSWQERLSALRNVPPVLKIVWQSGPGVVTFGIVARVIAALLPVAITFVTKLIIDIIDNHLRNQAPVPRRLWWLVGGEFGLAGVGSVVDRRMAFRG